MPGSSVARFARLGAVCLAAAGLSLAAARTAHAEFAIVEKTLFPYVVGTPASGEIRTEGGTAPCTWSIAEGALPAGLSIVSAFVSTSCVGEVYGTMLPEGTPGPYPVTVQVQDALGNVATRQYTYRVYTRYVRITAFFPEVPPGRPASFALTTEPKLEPPFSWAIVSGSLPPGLTLHGAEGTIDGTPAARGTWRFTLQVLASDGGGFEEERVIHVVDTSPATVWRRRLDLGRREQAGDVVADGRGKIYVTGTARTGRSDDDCITMGLDGSGSVLWSSRWGGAFTDERCERLELAPSGGLYVAASLYPASNQGAVVRYDGAGAELWSRILPGRPLDTAVDAAGNLLVAGVEGGGPASRVFVRRYTAAGDVTLERSYGLWNLPDFSAAVVAAPGGGFYVAATSYLAPPDPYERNRSDLIIARCDDAGEVLGTQQYDRANDYAADMVVAPSGRVGLSGMSCEWGITMCSFLLLTFDPAGGLLWDRAFLGVSDRGNLDPGIAVDGLGSFYLSGSGMRGHGPDVFYRNEDFDFLTVKYDAAGAEVWAERTNAHPGSEFARGVALTREGEVIVAGSVGRLCADGAYDCDDMQIVRYRQPLSTRNVQARWSRSMRMLTVSASSTARPRRTLTLLRYGIPLRWQVDRQRWEARVLNVRRMPAAVRVAGPDGTVQAAVREIR